MAHDVILDCYTDEPSGLGVPPYLGVHSRYLAGALELKKRDYKYLTIDDVRYALGERSNEKDTLNKRIINTTANKENALDFLRKAKTIYVVMGCFVKYEYVSAAPPDFDEVKKILSPIKSSKKILFYVLGGAKMPEGIVNKVIPQKLFDDVVFGNTYNYILSDEKSLIPNYIQLKDVSVASKSLLDQLERPLIIEIETATGCNRKPGCSFCVESVRGLGLQFREPSDIINEVKSLYKQGARHFRLGRQPNFYAYYDVSPDKVESLLSGIREACPSIKTLHIDNVSPHNVVGPDGYKITEHVVNYCTSGNIAAFGVESFDEKVQVLCNLNASIENVHESIKTLNKLGATRGTDNMPVYLPGINIIYGLPGQSERTLDINLEHFQKILESNYLVRRVFVRKLTSPYGEQFDQKIVKDSSEFDKWKAIIEKEFSIPMMKKLYPIDITIKNLRVEMYKDGNTILRQMGTCPERILIKDKKLELDTFHNAKITGYLKSRNLFGVIV